MTAPRCRVYLGLGSTWRTARASIVWTEVTNRVMDRRQPIRTMRGATSSHREPDAGDLGLALRNNDRKLDPKHTTGPWFGQLKAGVPIKVTGTPAGGTETPVWWGTVKGFRQRYDRGNRTAWVPISAFDPFDKLGRATIPRSVLEKEVLADSPAAYWKLDETSGPIAFDSSGNEVHAEYVAGTLALSSVIESAFGATHRGIQFDGEHAAVAPQHGAAVLQRPLVFSCLVAPDDTITAGRIIYSAGTGSSAGNLAALFTAVTADGWQAGGQVTGTGSGTYSTTQRLFQGVAHHVAFRVPAATDAEMYIDGENETLTPFSSGPGLLANGAVIGSIKYGTPRPTNAYLGNVSNLAIFDFDIGAARIAAHAAAAVAPLDGQTVDERMDWVLDELGWPADARDLDVARTILGPATFKPGDGALSYLRLLNASEDGRLFITADGKLRLLNRYHPWRDTSATVPQATFTDTPGFPGVADIEIDPDDDSEIVNIARYTRRGGTQQTARDEDSIDDHGELKDELGDLLVPTDLQALSLARWAVALRAEPVIKIPKLRVLLHKLNATQQAQILALEIGDRIRVTRTPQKVGSALTFDCIVEGISHEEITKVTWVTEFVVSPAFNVAVPLFTLGTSQLGGTHVLAH